MLSLVLMERWAAFHSSLCAVQSVLVGRVGLEGGFCPGPTTRCSRAPPPQQHSLHFKVLLCSGLSHRSGCSTSGVAPLGVALGAPASASSS